jgi:hypothetical protein
MNLVVRLSRVLQCIGAGAMMWAEKMTAQAQMHYTIFFKRVLELVRAVVSSHRYLQYQGFTLLKEIFLVASLTKVCRARTPVARYRT